MELERILRKIIANEELTAYEQSFLLDFFAALQRQNVTKLGDVAYILGTVYLGNGMTLNSDGITIVRGGTTEGVTDLSMISWVDSAGVITAYIQDVSTGGENLFSIRKTRADGESVTNSKIRLHLRNSDVSYTNGGVAIAMVANATDTYLRLQMGAVDGSLYNAFQLQQIADAVGAVLFNADMIDMDFTFRGDTDANLFKVDAGLDAIGIGGAAESGKKFKVTGDINIRHILPFGVFTAISPFSGTSNPYSASIDRTLTFVRWSQTYYVATTNDATNYWTIDLLRGDGSTIKSINTSAASANTDTLSQVTTFDIASVGTSDKLIYIRVTKTLAPGNLTLYGPTLEVTG